jgi:hypothetical protein
MDRAGPPSSRTDEEAGRPVTLLDPAPRVEPSSAIFRCMRLRVNAPQVIHESIDDEVVVVNLESGSYYSLAGTAAKIWGLLDEGVLLENLPDVLLESLEGDESEVVSSVAEFVSELRADELMVPDDAEPSSSRTPTAGNGARAPFEPPRFERFTDMKHLIALDPIHQVDGAQGWPHT